MSRGFHDRWITIPLFIGVALLMFFQFADIQKRLHGRNWFAFETYKEEAPWLIGFALTILVLIVLVTIRHRRKRREETSE